jgi:putative ABC transport system permease protein
VFDVDRWQEIWSTLAKNKLRTSLTALGVFWGIFLLLLMIGFGNGLQRGAYKTMGGFRTNAVFVWGQSTSMPYRGLKPGRYVSFDNADVDAIRRTIPGIEALAPRDSLGGFGRGTAVTRGDKVGSFNVTGDVPEVQIIQPMLLVAGRLLDPLDVAESRKIAVIGTRVVDELFPGDKHPIGKSIQIRGVYFMVVGIMSSQASGDEGDRQNGGVQVPLSTFQRAFQRGRNVGWFALAARPDVSAVVIEREVKQLLMRRHHVSPPDDEQALGSFNADKEFRKVQGLFTGIRAFIWFVGVCTLLAGVVGVSNIMLIAVKERTKEIGVRKALGATPGSVIALVMQESVVLTSLAGYMGVVAAVGLLEGISWLMAKMAGGGGGMAFFHDPTVDLNVALVATGILVISGCIAGIMPARHAAKISPCEALRAE